VGLKIYSQHVVGCKVFAFFWCLIYFCLGRLIIIFHP
jgi:hypothetical protein